MGNSDNFLNDNNDELDGSLYLPYDNLGTAFFKAEELLSANSNIETLKIILLSKSFELSKDILTSASYTKTGNSIRVFGSCTWNNIEITTLDDTIVTVYLLDESFTFVTHGTLTLKQIKFTIKLIDFDFLY